jgi:FtsP/CotA-like multicopper oxidase with cupredoxin domain
MAPNNDRSMFTMFASLLSVSAFLLAAIGIIVVVAEDDGGGGAVAAAAPVTVNMSEFAFTPSTVTVSEGGSLNLVNNGTMAHNLAIDGGPASGDVQPGGTATLDLSDLAVGTYRFICTIPGHEASGMVGELTVSTGPAPVSGETAGGSSATETHDWAAMDQAMLDRTNQYLQDVLGTVATPAANMWGSEGPLGTPTEGRGNQKLEPTILEDGTKQFDLVAEITDWEVAPGQVVQAWTYNGMVPSPWIKVNPGDQVRVNIQNNLPVFTDIHFHGITTPMPADGVAPITQAPILPGESWTYNFTAPSTPELGMYHPHNHGDISVVNGMFGVFQVGDVPLPRGRTISGIEIPADMELAQEVPMVLNDAGEIGLSLNGKSFPATDPLVTVEGDWTLVHYYNEGLTAHPMHLHHTPQLVVAKEGFPLDSPYWVDTVNVAPGERYSVLIHSRPEDINIESTPEAPLAEQLGIWAYHCHILTHAENEEGLFGMVTVFVVVPASAV